MDINGIPILEEIDINGNPILDESVFMNSEAAYRRKATDRRDRRVGSWTAHEQARAASLNLLVFTPMLEISIELKLRGNV